MSQAATSPKPRILVFVRYYLPGNKSGGPVRTLANLIDATHHRYDYRVVTFDRDLGDDHAYENVDLNGWNDVGPARVRYVAPGWTGLRQIAAVIKNARFDVMYLNSFFSLAFGLWPQWCNRGRAKPVILGPRGQFSRGAYGLKAFKKRLYVAAYKLIGAHKRVVWQATTEHDCADIINVMGSDIKVIEADNIASRRYATELPAKQPDLLRVVFISRISRMKNLDYALNVLREINVPMTFDIFGPAEDAQYWSECQKLIEQLPTNISVHARGRLPSAEVVNALSRYDVFFFPTKGENFGHVIAEALCAGLPLLIADTTPWRNLAAEGIGFDLPLDSPDGFATQLTQMHAMDIATHAAWRQDILDWAKKRFEQSDAVEANERMFEKVLARSG